MSKKKDYSYLLDIIKLAQTNKEVKDEDKIRIKYDGSFFNEEKSSIINSNLCSLFIKDPTYNISVSSKIDSNNENFKNKIIADNIGKALDRVDFFITHSDKPSLVLPPKKSKRIIFQNWNFGSIPIEWKTYFLNYADQIWVSSNYNKSSYIKSGISEKKIKVVNSAVDSVFYNHNVEAIDLKIDKKIKFLFKGNLDLNSGIDNIIKAYTQEFSNTDDVCLVISTNKEAIEKNISDYLKEVLKNPENPYIHIIDLPYDEKSSAKLYKACNYYISLNKDNGYCLDIIESMACSVPTIVMGKGAVLDYCNDSNSILLDSYEVFNTTKEINEIKTENYPSWFECSLEEIKIKLRKAYKITEEDYEILSSSASKTILGEFTWIKQKDKIDLYIQEIKNIKSQIEIQTEVNEGIISALSELKEKNYDKSFEILKDILEKSPENPDINFYLANLYFNKKEYSLSLDYLLKSLSINSNNEDYNNLTGVILFKLEEYDLAKKFFYFTLKIMPEHEGAKQSLEIIAKKEKTTTNTHISSEQIKLIDSIISYFKKSYLPSICVGILSKNEEKHIERAIRSAKKFADEIIVLDTGSTDRTIQIAEKLGINVIKTEWKNDFSMARNELLKNSKSDWIIMLDSDEAFAESSIDKIKHIIMTLDDSKTGTVKITNFLDKNGILEKFEHYVTRIIPNNKGFKFTRAIHEIPVDSLNNIPETEILKEIEILHYGYKSNIVKEKNKIKRNRDILLESIVKEPNDFLNYFYLAENYKDEDDYESVIKYSEKALEKITDDNLYTNTIELCKINILEAMINSKNTSDFEDKFIEFESSLEKRPDYWFIRANYELSKNNYDQAISYYEKCMDLRTQNISSSIDLGTITWKSLYNIALVYDKKGDKDKALTYINRALKNSENNTLILYQKLKFILDYSQEDNIFNLFLLIYKNINEEMLISLLNDIKDLFLKENMINKIYPFLEELRKNYDKKSTLVFKSLVEYYNIILEKFEDNSPVLYSLAYCYNIVGNTDKSKELFEKIVKENTSEVDSLHNIASIYLNDKNINRAEETYKKVLESDPFHYESYISLTKLELLKGNINEAEKYLERLMEIDPDNKMINNLSFEIAMQKDDTKLASDMYSAMLFYSKRIL